MSRPLDWIRDDQESFGEGVARCRHGDCRAPLHFELTENIIFIRCAMRHMAELHVVYPEPFAEA